MYKYFLNIFFTNKLLVRDFRENIQQLCHVICVLLNIDFQKVTFT